MDSIPPKMHLDSSSSLWGVCWQVFDVKTVYFLSSWLHLACSHLRFGLYTDQIHMLHTKSETFILPAKLYSLWPARNVYRLFYVKKTKGTKGV